LNEIISDSVILLETAIGVVPVTPSGRSIRETVQDQLPFVYQRIQRDLNQVSSSVMDAIDKYSSQQQL
jgi:hypothetical protein